MENETLLLKRIQEGNREAQHELYTRLAGQAMAVAMRFVANTEAARDILQEAFVKVFTHIDSFNGRGEGTLRAWVMRIVSNESINWMKQEKRLTMINIDEEPDTTEESFEEPPDIAGVSPDVLQRLIEQLPDGYRTVFTLFVFEQKSHKEIANLLGIRENSSASQFFHAKKMLKNMINKYKSTHHR